MDTPTEKTQLPHASSSVSSTDAVTPPQTSADEPPRQIRGFKTADTQPAILNTFQGFDGLPWLSAGFGLGATSILIWSKSYGLFNAKWVYILSVLLFEAGCALCGAAPTMNAMIVGRVLAGLGGAGMYSGALFLLSVTTTSKERPLYLSLTAITWGLGTVLGPVVGGAFAGSTLTWRWAFYINLPIAGAMAPLYLFCIPNINLAAGLPVAAKFRKLDFLGIIVYFGGMTCFTMAISFGGVVYAWNSAAEIVLWIMTGVLLLVQTLLIRFHPAVDKADRVYPGHFVKRPLLVNLQLQMMFIGGINLGNIFYLPLYFQFARGDTPIQAAVRLLPYIFMIVFFSPANGFLMGLFGYYKPSYMIGAALMVVGTSLMLTITSETPPAAVYGFSILTGIGIGLNTQSGFAVGQALVDPASVADMVSFMSVAQAFGGIFFPGIAGTLYNNLVGNNVREFLPASVGAAGLSSSLLYGGASSPAFTSLASSVRMAVVQAVIDALKGPWGLFAAASAICFVLSCFLGHQRINQKT